MDVASGVTLGHRFRYHQNALVVTNPTYSEVKPYIKRW